MAGALPSVKSEECKEWGERQMWWMCTYMSMTTYALKNLNLYVYDMHTNCLFIILLEILIHEKTNHEEYVWKYNVSKAFPHVHIDITHVHTWSIHDYHIHTSIHTYIHTQIHQHELMYVGTNTHSCCDDNRTHCCRMRIYGTDYKILIQVIL